MKDYLHLAGLGCKKLSFARGELGSASSRPFLWHEIDQRQPAFALTPPPSGMGCNSSKASAQDPPTAYHASGGANSTTIGNASVAPSLRSQELVVTGGGSFILSRGDAEAPIGSSNSSSSSNASAGGGSGGATGAAAHPSAVSSASASDNSSSSSDGPLSADPGGGTMVVSKGGSYVIGRKYAGAWEPGTPIERPDNFLSARSAYIPLDEQKTRFLKLSYSAYSEQGKSPKPPIKPNQDSFVAIEKLGNDEHLALFGVFDGHGPKGEDASNFCRINLPDITVRAPGFQQQPFEALRRSFEATHKRFISPEVSRLPGVDVAVSGSTAIAVMFNRDLLTCANVGDSRAMIGTLGPRGNMIARPLSIDHKPNRPEERARLMQASGRILSERQLGIEGGDPDKFYVCRLHGGTIRYGVLFTRSIGDADGHANLGLSSAPEVKAGRLDSRDKFVVLATDGVWDYRESLSDVNAERP